MFLSYCSNSWKTTSSTGNTKKTPRDIFCTLDSSSSEQSMITNKTVYRNRLTLDCGITIAVDSPEWFDWLDSVNAFYYKDYGGSFTATRRGSGDYWYAQKTVLNSKRTLYLGKTCTLNLQKLMAARSEICLSELTWKAICEDKKKLRVQKG